MGKNFFGELLLDWYGQNRRELPWKETSEPYSVWISEVILQQTRVAQGMNYYLRFMERFPDVKSLAEATEEEVMKYWEGLGYYSRARNLHKAAREIMTKFGGKFPDTYTDVKSLPGIGDYTAAAICSFAFSQPYAVLDGNVYRVLARIFDITTPIDSGEGKKYFTHLAEELLVKEQSAVYNQAIMDFGALQCTPQNPDCIHCPFKKRCLAKNSNKISQLPVKKAAKKTVDRYFHYLDIHYQGNCLIKKRTTQDIWQNLFEFPLIETETSFTPEDFLQSKEFKALFPQGIPGEISKIFGPVKHILSHRIIYAIFYRMELTDLPNPFHTYKKVSGSEINHYAFPQLIRKYFEI